jgi:hypothetical protein
MESTWTGLHGVLQEDRDSLWVEFGGVSVESWWSLKEISVIINNNKK